MRGGKARKGSRHRGRRGWVGDLVVRRAGSLLRGCFLKCFDLAHVQPWRSLGEYRGE